MAPANFEIKIDSSSTVEDILNFKKTEIQQFLRQNNLKITGSKHELANRAFNYVTKPRESCDQPQMSEVSDDCIDSAVCDSDVPDYDNLKTGWTSDTTMFPVPSHKDVEHYLINSRHRTVDHKKMKCYRQYIREYSFYKEKYIHKIMCNTIDDNSKYVYVRSKCFPSMKKGVYSQWVLMTKSAPIRVVKASCTCPAGLGEGCTHVAGLLFALENSASSTDENDIACTSKPCEWNKPSKRKNTSKEITNITFKRLKPDHGGCVKPVSKSNIKEKKPKESVNNMNFREKLCNKLHNKCAVIFDLQDPPPKQTEDDIISTLNVASFVEVNTSEYIEYQSDKYINLNNTVEKESFSPESFVDFVTNVPVNVIEEIEVRTRKQHNNNLWKDSREGRITASIFHDVKTRKDSTPPEKLVDKIIGKSTRTDDDDEIEALKWGTTKESVAKNKYIATKKLKFKETVVINEKGLCLCRTCGFLGASPDGVVKSDISEYLIEVKCPYKWRYSSVHDACNSKTFCCFIDDDNKIKLKRNHRYYTQIQGQMAVCGYERCELVIFTLKDLQIIEI